MSQWTSPGRIVTGLVSAAALGVALASMSGTQRAQSLGLTRHGQTLTAQDAGAADAVAVVAVAPGTAGQVYTISDAGLPHWAAAPAATTVVTYYASDGTASAGAGVDATASVTGTGASSRVVMGVTATGRLLSGSVIACGTWVSPSIPQSARRITLYLRTTAVSGMTSGGFRYFQASLRRAAEAPPANLLLGVAMHDNASALAGNMRGGSNAAPYAGLPIGTNPILGGTDRWARIEWDRPGDGMGARLWTNASTGSTRPSGGWVPINTPLQTAAATAAAIGSPGAGNLQIILGLESYGSGTASSLTLDLTLEVET